MTTSITTAVTDQPVPVSDTVPDGHVTDDGHAGPETTTTDGHEAAGWPGHGVADTTAGRAADTGHVVDPTRLAEYFVERREVSGHPAAVTWTTIATGAVELDQPGAEALEGFVDGLVEAARAVLHDHPLRVSAMVRAAGHATYAEVPVCLDAFGYARPGRGRPDGVGQPVHTQRRRRRTRRGPL